MTIHLQFPLKKYNPHIVAAEFDLENAEAEYEAIRNLPIDEFANCVPVTNAQRFQAAKARLEKAHEFYNKARLGDRLRSLWN